MKNEFMRRMFEWHIETRHDWSVRAGAYGKWLKKRIAPEIWQEFEQTYAGAGADENWDALFRLIALYRKVARGVGESLGYAYPEDLHQRVIAYLQRVRQTPGE